MKPLHIRLRARIDDDSARVLINACEPTEDRVWIARNNPGQKYAFLGVRTSDVDVVITDDVADPRDPRDMLVLELADKAGKYNGRLRDRVTVRRMHSRACEDFPFATIDVTTAPGETFLVIALGDGSQTLRRWRRLQPASMGDYNVARVLMWHWRRYYTHLDDGDEIRRLADAWASTIDPSTSLAAANRAASRELYRYSRDLGWRKLTLREQGKYGVQGSWHRISDIDALRGDGETRTGCGDYTIDNAHAWEDAT